MTFDKKEFKKLLDDIDKYDDAYYNKDTQIVSDQEYDGVKDRLIYIFKNNEFVPKAGSKMDERLFFRLEDAVTRVGAPPPLDGKWQRVTHEVPMGSLHKCNTPDEFDTWAAKCGLKADDDVFDTEKLDGISVGMQYVNGEFIMGYTRGNGIYGEDITRNVKKMKGVPHKLTEDFTGHVRGEIVLRHSDWKKHLSSMENPRNGASGVAKRISGKDSEHLTVLSYTIDGKDFATEVEAIEGIEALGFQVPNWCVTNVAGAKKLWQIYMDKTRESLDYDIDGKVIRVNDMAKQLALGEESKRPVGAIAFKFESPKARTECTDITDQVGDTGHITPVAIFDPVELLGAKVKRASLHNYSLVKKLGINIGAEIIVERANDVIPYISEVTKKNGDAYKAPSKCPACGAKTHFVGEYLVCPNKKDCPPQVIGRLNKWIKELGILEWGESVLTKLIDAGLVSDVGDIYRLTADDIAGLDRMGKKSADNLIKELDKFRAIPLENFLGGLCIDGVATSTVKSIIKEGHDTLDAILGLSTKELESVPGFAEKRALAFHNGLIDNADRIEDIIDAGVTIKARAKGKLTGATFCFTGAMKTPRAKLQKIVEDNGGEVKKSVGKGLKYLVIADPTSTSSKASAARKNNTTLISEEDFLGMI